MQKPQAETPFANTDLNDEVMEEAQERLAQAMGSLTMAFAELGMAEDLAAMFRQDPLKAEVAFRDGFNELACSVLRDAFELIDDHGVSLEAGGETYRKVEASTGHAMTLFGPVAYSRARCRHFHAGRPVASNPIPFTHPADSPSWETRNDVADPTGTRALPCGQAVKGHWRMQPMIDRHPSRPGTKPGCRQFMIMPPDFCQRTEECVP